MDRTGQVPDLERAVAASTDPDFVRRQFGVPQAEPVSPPRADGRHHRAATTRLAIVTACRRLMMEGDFRPSMEACCKAAGRSVRIAFTHFQTVGALHAEALEDGVVRDCVAAIVIGAELVALSAETRDRVVRCVVLGRP